MELTILYILLLDISYMICHPLVKYQNRRHTYNLEHLISILKYSHHIQGHMCMVFNEREN